MAEAAATLRITCPSCHKAGNAPVRLVGKTVRCSQCGMSFLVQAATPAAAAPAAAAAPTAAPPPTAVPTPTAVPAPTGVPATTAAPVLTARSAVDVEKPL